VRTKAYAPAYAKEEGGTAAAVLMRVLKDIRLRYSLEILRHSITEVLEAIDDSS
jgi:hypothetical protein